MPGLAELRSLLGAVWRPLGERLPELAVCLTAVLFTLSIVHVLVGDLRMWRRAWRDWLAR